jgi:hypothetical protein
MGGFMVVVHPKKPKEDLQHTRDLLQRVEYTKKIKDLCCLNRRITSTDGGFGSQMKHGKKEYGIMSNKSRILSCRDG